MIKSLLASMVVLAGFQASAMSDSQVEDVRASGCKAVSADIEMEAREQYNIQYQAIANKSKEIEARLLASKDREEQNRLIEEFNAEGKKIIHLMQVGYYDLLDQAAKNHEAELKQFCK